MILTEEEESILKGQRGPGRRRALEFLIKTGEAFEAKRFIPISYAHLIIEEAQKFGGEAEIGEAITALFTEGVDSFAVPTTLNPLLLNLSAKDKAKIPDDLTEKIALQMAKPVSIYEGLGAIPAYSCTPYYFHPVRVGEHVAVTEGEVVLYTNSVLGARSHYESVPSALAAAIVGRVPEFGLHQKKNRRGQVLVKISRDLLRTAQFSDAEYGALALWSGEKLEDKLAVWEGLPKGMTEAELKYFSMAHCIGGSPGMFHIVGVTPEAMSKDMAFGGRKPDQIIEVGRDALNEAYQKCTSASAREIDTVLIGCPHCTLKEMEKLALLLDGKKVDVSVRLWIVTNRLVKDLASRMGYIEKIETAGGAVLWDMCIGSSLLAHSASLFDVKTVVTNSTCPALFIPPLSLGEIRVYYFPLEKCIGSALSGSVDGGLYS